MLAAVISLLGCVTGPLKVRPWGVDIGFVCFGVYCLLIGYLIFRSALLPRIAGALMSSGGLGYLTFLSQPLANYLSPYNLVPSILGEGALTVWLLVFGINAERWKVHAAAAK